MSNRVWTEARIALLKKQYPNHGRQSQIPGVSSAQIANKAGLLNLKIKPSVAKRNRQRNKDRVLS